MGQKVWVQLRAADGGYPHLKAEAKCGKKCIMIILRKLEQHAQIAYQT